jgi:hypothetical protein
MSLERASEESRCVVAICKHFFLCGEHLLTPMPVAFKIKRRAVSAAQIS